MRSDADRVTDSLDAVTKIKARMIVSLDAFQADEMLQVWVIHYLQVIGEAARGVSQSIAGRRPEVPWAQIVALRNILVHEYFGLNMEQVWNMVIEDLPALEAQVLQIRSDITSGRDD